MPIDANETNLYSYLEMANTDVLVDFWAPWCGPCRMLAPTLKRLESDHDIQVIKVNIDENPELARQYQVMSIPTMIHLKQDGSVKRIVGVKPQRELEKELGL